VTLPYTLVFFLEEPSAKAMLEGLLPRILPDGWMARYVVFEGKQDLNKQLQRKLRGWQQPQCLFVVLRDQDSGECQKIKAELVQQCTEAGQPQTLVRIACHELESWYLGNLKAVQQVLNVPYLARQQNNRKYRSPDKLGNPSQELLKLTAQKYQKVGTSRQLGPHMLADNTSISFGHFLTGLRRLIDHHKGIERC